MLENMRCWLLHRKFWGVIYASGENCVCRCSKCRVIWRMDRMEWVLSSIPDKRDNPTF